MKTAAFFDIDGTLYREGMLTSIFKKMIKSEIIDQATWHNDLKAEFELWDQRKGDYDNYLLKMAALYIKAIKGLHKSQIEFMAKKAIEQKGDRVYQYTRDRIKWHHEQGHLVFTVSGSPIELVREMSLKYGVTDYVGSEYMMENERYTGEVHPMWDSDNKQKALDKLVRDYNIDLSASYAYGDTAGDFSMFKAVGHPVAMNATRELINMVTADQEVANKIHIIIERKDMIYQLTAQCLSCPENKG